MRIEGIDGLPLKLDVEKKEEESKTSFSDLLKNFIKDVNNDLINAKNIEQDLALGKIQNIQDAMYQIEKADISFRLLTEIRNKALESYQEIMRMQV
ncbi:flagellar hook-basal body complex protein FliE [Sulfurihydrogenibium sp.]|jgi:flagellar hook-basal body complex protein FliE|uniref:flagellar hook-basal body complex protein FliE n=1 Tax=Sulfurihydrogenibium sp. TaxID=2053621 RepID=UPI00260C8CC1|nr:flagellar hook-basal body complex protein FliE [Sulfurihydrogenibium sp.]